MVVPDGTGGLISMVRNSFFQGPVGFTYVLSCAVIGWGFPVVDYISFHASRIGSFGCMSKDLMMLVPVKKTLTLYFARVSLYCSVRPIHHTYVPHSFSLWHNNIQQYQIHH